MDDESGDESGNNSEPGRNDDGQTTGTTAILGLSPATHFLLQSLPRPGAAMMPEHAQELDEELQELERTGEGRTVTPPVGRLRLKMRSGSESRGGVRTIWAKTVVAGEHLECIGHW